MLDFDDLKENIDDFISEKPLLAVITAIILFFFLVAMVVIFIQSSKPKSNVHYEKTDIILDEKPLTPMPVEIEKEYYQSRNTENTWTEEQIKEWFSQPDSRMLSELEKTNDKIVSEITGATP